MATPTKPVPVLTPDQIQLVEQNYTLNIRELVRLVFNDNALTLRSDPEVKAVKQALASVGKHVNPVPSPKEAEQLAELTEENKEYIRNNLKDSSGPLEIARTIYDNPNLLPSSKQCQAIYLYCRQIDPNYKRDEEMTEETDYQPPRTLNILIGKVNKYASNKNAGGKALFDPGKLTPSQTQQLEALHSYMKMPLFKVEADKFVKKIDRDVFESTFISNCWDKSDLPSEHVIQFIQLSSMIVKYNQIDRMMQKVDLRVSAMLDDNTRLSMTDVDALSGLQEKGTAAMKQINALIKSLTGERARITDEKRLGNASMHNLVQAWKNEEDRRKIIQLAERRQKAALKQEVERLSSMDALKIELFGLSKSDIVS